MMVMYLLSMKAEQTADAGRIDPAAPAAAPLTGTLAPAPSAGAAVPARAYLAGLAPSGRRGMTTALTQAAEYLTQGAGTIDTTPWQRLRADHVVALKAAMAERGAAPATVNRMVGALRGVARSCWRAGLITADDQQRIRDVPLSKARRLPAGRHVTAGEIAALFDVCDLAQPVGARDAALLSLLYGAGLRRTEAVALDRADYDRATGRITVTGKGGHQRHVWAASGGKVALDAWVEHRGGQPGPLLRPVAKGGKIEARRLTAQAVLMRLQGVKGRDGRYRGGLAQRAGIPRFSPHDLRRSFVGDLLDAGADLAAVQRLAGHASVQTTARYDRRGDRAAQRAAGMLHVPVRAA